MRNDKQLEGLQRDLARLRSPSNVARGRNAERGREADRPGEIPPRGWKDILWRAWREVSDQNLFLIAGGSAVTATLLWIVASIGFTVYVANFNSYDKTYGSLGGVVILLTWLYLSAFNVLLGAVINAQSERQTRNDSTEGTPRPMGQRDAHAADTLGKSPG